jgi:hypothetical protein
MMSRIAFALLALTATQPVLGQSPSAPAAAQIAPTEQATIDRAMARAQLIYWYDQAAWHGTDDMLAKARDIANRIGGWIVDGPADAPTLIFYSRDAQQMPLYLARFEQHRLVEGRKLGEADAALLTPERRRLIAAVAAARAALTAAGVPCCVDKPFNTVALPAAAPGESIAVYFLTPQTDTASIPMGGHFLVDVDATGKAGPIRRFTNGCMSIPTTGPKGKPVALTVTHLLDPVPTELHGFSAMAARLPLIVITRDKRLWAVQPAASGPRVRLLQPK